MFINPITGTAPSLTSAMWMRNRPCATPNVNRPATVIRPSGPSTSTSNVAWLPGLTFIRPPKMGHGEGNPFAFCASVRLRYASSIATSNVALGGMTESAGTDDDGDDVPPSERLVLGVKFAIALTFSLTAIEIAHLALLHTWNSEVFAAITGLAGTITGILISQKTGE